MEDLLLIGNGPSVLRARLGDEIDGFSGKIVRFNNYSIAGFEEFVGSRTDFWVTLAKFREASSHVHEKRFFCRTCPEEEQQRIISSIGGELEVIPHSSKLKTGLMMQFNHPSTGAIMTGYFLDKGYNIWIYGFDYLNEELPHHYNGDGIVRGPWHNYEKEKAFFKKLIESDKIHLFGSMINV